MKIHDLSIPPELHSLLFHEAKERQIPLTHVVREILASHYGIAPAQRSTFQGHEIPEGVVMA